MGMWMMLLAWFESLGRLPVKDLPPCRVCHVTSKRCARTPHGQVPAFECVRDHQKTHRPDRKRRTHPKTRASLVEGCRLCGIRNQLDSVARWSRPADGDCRRVERGIVRVAGSTREAGAGCATAACIRPISQRTSRGAAVVEAAGRCSSVGQAIRFIGVGGGGFSCAGFCG